MLCDFIPEREAQGLENRPGRGGAGKGGLRHRKTSHRGPVTLQGGWRARVPLPGGFSRPSGQASTIPCRRRGLGGELLPVVCYEIVPKLLKQRRSSQLQQRKTQTMTAPPLNKEGRHYS